MTQLRLGGLTHCPDHGRAILALEDLAGRWRLALAVEPHEAGRLGRELGQAGCRCNPIYDFIQALVATFEAGLLKVVLDDVNGAGVGAFLYLGREGAELPVACYPPDAVALALRAQAPIYATPEAMAHACPTPLPPDPPPGSADLRRWLERVTPQDFDAPGAPEA